MWGIELQRSSEIPLKRQIYLAVRDQIINGKLKAGEALPSTRVLANVLHVSRNTINEAIEMLLVEGFVVSRQGAPTRIAEGLSLDDPPVEEQPKRVEPPFFLVDFRTGQPELRQFPRYLWQQISQKTLSEMPPDLLGYTGPQGLPRLRMEIVSWLYRSKGLSVDPEDVFITAGATHALHVIADLLYEDGMEIMVEDPATSRYCRHLLIKATSSSLFQWMNMEYSQTS